MLVGQKDKKFRERKSRALQGFQKMIFEMLWYKDLWSVNVSAFINFLLSFKNRF